ncbi:hypothetical protein Taro_054346 [Colocasia esculenta]|uniref:GDSL esterase/lipase n=1 Tax=Colocasia esculenta TaxID=4460 RepID=A0A843XN95_COLES|nr:hypothetical protein [Colocasia esculenta]
MSYSFVDGYSSFIDYIQKPSAYGFVDVETACCGRGKLNAEDACRPNTTYCSDRNSRVFWDANHPTERVYRVFTDTIFDGAPPYVMPVNVRNLVGL